MVRVKICGITNLEDAQAAVAAGANALGFIFYKKSPRYISPTKAKSIVEKIPPFVVPVGVFVNEKEKVIKDICHQSLIGTIQFHGDEPPAFLRRFKGYTRVKAFRVRNAFDFKILKKYPAEAFLFDTFQEKVYGGSGQSFNWDVLKGKRIPIPFVLSGGLSVKNIQKALKIIKPFAVDVSSGVEKRPGIKDHSKIKQFVSSVRLFS